MNTAPTRRPRFGRIAQPAGLPSACRFSAGCQETLTDKVVATPMEQSR